MRIKRMKILTGDTGRDIRGENIKYKVSKKAKKEKYECNQERH